MSPNQFTRDAGAIKSALKEIDNRLVAVKPIRVYIPVRFQEHGLADIGIETSILGMCAIATEDRRYGVLMVTAKIRIDPTSTIKVMFDDDEYYEFYFEPGSTFITTLDLVKNDSLIDPIFNEFIINGYVPWYLAYILGGGVFDTAREHAGANIGQQREVSELFISMIARNPKNRREYYRQSITSFADIERNPPVWVGLKSVDYSATNTTNKLLGNYFDQGVNSALVNPTTRVESLEATLRL